MRLNIGAGPEVHPGWWAMDRDAYPDLDHQGDVLDGIPLPNGSAECAYAGHVLQMVAWPKLHPWLAEVRRVVRPGGALRLSVPDALGAFVALTARDRDWFPIDHSYEPSVDGAFCMYLTQAGATRSIFTEAHLVDLCLRSGWSSAWTMPYGRTRTPYAHITDLDNRPNESLYVEAM